MQTMELSENERKLRDELQQRVSTFSIEDDYETRKKALDEMRNMAIELHISLKHRGLAPQHHAYMIANRGMQPDDPEFYFHLHPIQDLLAFSHNAKANDDPVDQTIDKEFEFRVFTRRWGHYDNYRIKRTSSGWFLKANLYTGPCDKSCTPLLYDCLTHDSVSYPSQVGQWFDWLWHTAKDQGLNGDAVQKGLDDISDWIKVTEQHTPVDGIWEGLA